MAPVGLDSVSEAARPVLWIVSRTASDLEIRDRCRRELERRNAFWGRMYASARVRLERTIDYLVWEWRAHHLVPMLPAEEGPLP